MMAYRTFCITGRNCFFQVNSTMIFIVFNRTDIELMKKMIVEIFSRRYSKSIYGYEYSRKKIFIKSGDPQLQNLLCFVNTILIFCVQIYNKIFLKTKYTNDKALLYGRKNKTICCYNRAFMINYTLRQYLKDLVCQLCSYTVLCF